MICAADSLLQIRPLDDNKLLACAGPIGDTVAFGEYVSGHVALYNLRHDIKLSTSATASWVRANLAHALRTGPFQVNMLLGGVDANKKPSLYFIDYLASCHPMKFAAHGYGANFVLSTLDRFYRPDMDKEEAMKVMEKCIYEIRTRFLINTPRFQLKIVTADGVEVINPAFSS